MAFTSLYFNSPTFLKVLTHEHIDIYKHTIKYTPHTNSVVRWTIAGVIYLLCGASQNGELLKKVLLVLHLKMGFSRDSLVYHIMYLVLAGLGVLCY